MRVAVVAEETARHVDTDAAARLGRLAELLGSRGHEVTVFCARWWDGSPRSFAADGVEYRAVIDDEDVPNRRLITRLPGPLRSFDPDVIHATHANPFAVHAAKIASLVSRTPLLVDWYDVADGVGWRQRATAAAAKLPDVVVTPSRLVETEVRELGRPVDRIRVVPTGIDMDLIREVDPDPVADIVYSRRLDGDANAESLLLALAELRELGWEAAVIGEGPERRVYERQAADLRIDDRVSFLGDLPLERRLAIFKGAHVAVHTATRAPFATEFLRALACGCVGIAEYHVDSSAHELIEHFDRGVRTTSEDELVDAIRDAAGRPREDVEERFADYDESAVLERYLACYRELQAQYGLL